MRKVILDTDFQSDCDDAVAIRLLCNAHLLKQVELLGICMDACTEESGAGLDAYVTSMGLPDLPLALDREDRNSDVSRYLPHLAKQPHKRTNEDMENPVRFYRRLLAASPEPVDMLGIGFPQVFVKLLRSQADDLSSLTGRDLVAKKVRRLWIMAGKWDEQGAKEYNLSMSPQICRWSAELCRDWPVPITFLGFEIGNTVFTGAKLPEDDLLRQILHWHGSDKGRFSWDPMLVALAVCGDPAKAGYEVVRGRASVDPETGRNYFENSDSGPHEYVKKLQTDTWYSDWIDRHIVFPLEEW